MGYFDQFFDPAATPGAVDPSSLSAAYQQAGPARGLMAQDQASGPPPNIPAPQQQAMPPMPPPRPPIQLQQAPQQPQAAPPQAQQQSPSPQPPATAPPSSPGLPPPGSTGTPPVASPPAQPAEAPGIFAKMFTPENIARAKAAFAGGMSSSAAGFGKSLGGAFTGAQAHDDAIATAKTNLEKSQAQLGIQTAQLGINANDSTRQAAVAKSQIALNQARVDQMMSADGPGGRGANLGTLEKRFGRYDHMRATRMAEASGGDPAKAYTPAEDFALKRTLHIDDATPADIAASPKTGSGTQADPFIIPPGTSTAGDYFKKNNMKNGSFLSITGADGRPSIGTVQGN